MQALFVKMYVKMKELGLIGGHAPGTPPRSANDQRPHYICIRLAVILYKIYFNKAVVHYGQNKKK